MLQHAIEGAETFWAFDRAPFSSTHLFKRVAHSPVYNLQSVGPRAIGRQFLMLSSSPFLYIRTVCDRRQACGIRPAFRIKFIRAVVNFASGSVALICL